MTNSSKEKHKLVMQRYYQRTKEERLAYQKEYNEAHKSEINAYFKDYYNSNKEYFKEKSRNQKYYLPKTPKPPRVKKEKKEKLPKAEKPNNSDLPEILSPPKPLTRQQQKIKLQKYQYSLPQAEPFADFIKTPNGLFTLTF